MKILSIETSCDETAIAILEVSGPLDNPSIHILGNSLMSQVHLHEQYGGVYPNLAKREHQKNLPIILEKALLETSGKNLEPKDIDYIAVTQGPGLEPALWTGIVFAEELGKKWGKPVVPVNHMEGHIWSVLYQDEFSISNSQFSKLELPALALLVSGGHTELVYIKDFGSYEIIGRTKDDAVGEAFDKVARMLGLTYPGGPKISALANAHREKGLTPSMQFPMPMLHSGDLDFSYSGLKTAVLYATKKLDISDEGVKEEVARAFEDAAVGVLISKTRKALDNLQGVKTLIVGGGVASNSYLRHCLAGLIENYPEVSLRMPEKSLTTDNAVMIGLAAYVSITSGKDIPSREISANGNLLLGA